MFLNLNLLGGAGVGGGGVKVKEAVTDLVTVQALVTVLALTIRSLFIATVQLKGSCGLTVQPDQLVGTLAVKRTLVPLT